MGLLQDDTSTPKRNTALKLASNTHHEKGHGPTKEQQYATSYYVMRIIKETVFAKFTPWIYCQR
jgi:hypothetical protein